MSIKLDQHDELIIEQLKDADFAAAYLNEHLEYTGAGRRRHILHAIHLISVAQGISKVAKQSGLKKRSLYKALSDDGNPTLDTLLKLFETLHLKMSFSPSKKARKKSSRPSAKAA